MRWLLILLALLVLALTVYDLVHQLRYPTFDFYLAGHDVPTVAEVLPGGQAASAGLRAGDVILTVDGVDATSWAAPRLGETHAVTFARDGQRLALDIPAVSAARVNRRAIASAIVVVLAFWSAGTVLLWRRFREQPVRLFFLLSQAVAIALLTPLAHPHFQYIPYWLGALSLACFYLIAPLLLHHVLTFPAPLGSARQRRWGLAIAYGVSLTIAAVARPFNRPWTQWGMLYTAFALVGAIGILVYVYARRANPDGRRRLRLIVFGTILGGTPPLLFWLLPYVADATPRLPTWLTALFLVLVPLSYLVATARHNLFGIDRLINRTVVYLLLSLGILALYLGPFLAVYRFLRGDILVQMVVVAALTLLVGFGFDRARTRAQRLVDTLFYGGWYDYPGVVETVSDALARSIDRAQLGHVLTRRVPGLMRLSNGQLWFDEPDIGTQAGSGAPALRLPLSFQGQVRATWGVGPRRDGEDLSAGDQRILETLARQAEIALGNVLLIETLRRRIDEVHASREALSRTQHQLLRSREEERARLARDLHDGPIQELVALNMQLGLLLSTAQALAGSSAGELGTMRGRVRGLLDELRQVCAELRPPALDMLGLGAALRALAEQWGDQSNVRVDLALPPGATLPPLPGEVAVNLYRVAQESLSNVARHAEARRVTIGLAYCDDRVTLTVRDDGRGFVVPEALHNLASLGHFGLVGIQERVRLIGGTCAVESAPGRGTTIRVVWTEPNQAQM